MNDDDLQTFSVFLCPGTHNTKELIGKAF